MISIEISDADRLRRIITSAQKITSYLDAINSGNVTHSLGNSRLLSEIIRDDAIRLLEKTK